VIVIVLYEACTEQVYSYSGLGQKKVYMPLYSDSDDVNHYNLDTFPQLKGAGGYELLRSTSGRLLEVIPLPPDGYSATYLKDVVQQAKIYLRPIQKNLALDASTQNSVSSVLEYVLKLAL